MSTGSSSRVSQGEMPCFQRRQIDEGLEGGAGLAVRLGGAVEHRTLIVDAADQGRHRAVRLHHHHRRFAGRGRCLPYLPMHAGDGQRARLPGPWAPAWCARPGRRGLAPFRRPASWPGRRRCRGSNCAHPSTVRSITMAGWARASAACALRDGAGLHHRIQHQAGALLRGRADRAGARTPTARASASPASPPAAK